LSSLKASEDDLNSLSDVRVYRKLVSQNISDAITTRPAHVPGTTGYARDPSPTSDLSASSDEDKAEQVSRAIIADVITTIGFFNLPFIPPRGQKYNIAV
jgi:hypothetical protein